ncbi:alpha/beta hydrolase [Halosegnis marinus]|uniref:Alpha/beta hydrolase n=1 Tax=Halosegnis marinus TaxID=3034023 RepID=A0ABD5ZMF4_9EURY|nr:dienelactone hydrolase family protein [Halosegnis sp. DT85]
MSIDPHADEPIRTAGAPPQAAEAAVVLLHGRGDSPEGILRLVDDVYRRGVLYVAPAAAGRVWYPGGFAEPVTERREAFVESALGQVERALALAAETGIAPDRTVLAGFSQGAAVAAEYATRRPERFGGLGLLAGGLLGPTDALDPRDGSLAGTPAFLGVGDEDPYVGPAHVAATADVLRAMGAEVRAETYPDLGHAVGDGEIAGLNDLVGGVAPE